MPVEFQRLDGRPLPDGPGEIRAIAVVRNEMRRLRSMLGHHRELGVHRFLVVDNGSTDGTVDYLLAQPDVHLFQTRAPYRAARLGIDWIEPLLHEHGDGRWCLVLDADEQFVYPDCEFFRLPDFCVALEQHGLDCFATMFVDMYADGPIARTEPDRRPLIEICPFFDSRGYVGIPSPGSRIPRFYGGPRARLFWPEIDLRQDAIRIRAFVDRAFDEPAYLSLHADVRAAVAEGTMRSGLEHFLVYGHLEGRAVMLHAVPDWPEEIYLTLNPDVRAAVDHGTLASGLEHYVRYGQFDARRVLSSGPPCLSQVPLIRWSSRMRLHVGRHGLDGSSWRRNDTVGGCLLHFRLMADLASRADGATAVSSGDAEPVWALENQRYRDVLRADPGLTGMAPGWSVRYRDARQMLELGLVTPVSHL